MHEDQSAAPLFRPFGILIAMCVAIVLCWPMLLSGGIFMSEDTSSYLRGGEIIWSVLIELVEADNAGPLMGAQGTGSAVVEALAVDESGSSRVGRSFVYSLFSYLMLILAGPIGIAFTQATLIVFTFFALVEQRALESPAVLIIGGLLIATLTTLPWHSVYLMPDVFGSIIIVYGAVLMTSFSSLSALQKVSLTVLAALATATHYGNIPLMLAVGGSALIWLVFSRRLTSAAVVSVFCAVLFAPALNMVGSSLFLTSASVTPMRLPIILARSLADGPAYWYLSEQCATSSFAMCEAFGEDIPDSITDLLWADDGVQSLPPELLRRIRSEETELLAQVFFAYPVAQTASLAGNTFKQLTRFGTGQIKFARGVSDELRIEHGLVKTVYPPLRIADPVVTVVATVCFLALLGLAIAGRLHTAERRMFGAICIGLFFNAAIFGGLSAPVDRYQARAMWLIPALLVLVLAGRVSSRNRAPA